MVEVLKLVGAAIVWPFKKLAQLLMIDEKIDSVRNDLGKDIRRVDEKIDHTREVLQKDIHECREVLEAKIHNVEQSVQGLDKRVDSSLTGFRQEMNSMHQVVNGFRVEVTEKIDHLADLIKVNLGLQARVAELRKEVTRLKRLKKA